MFNFQNSEAFFLYMILCRHQRVQDSRCSDEDTDTRSVFHASESDPGGSARWLQTFFRIPLDTLEILPLQAESAPVDSDTWESGREEEG